MVRAWASPAIPSIMGLDLDPELVAAGNVTDHSLSFDITKEEASWIGDL